MKPRDAISGLLLIGSLTSCVTAEASQQQLTIETEAPSPESVLDIGSITVETTIEIEPQTIISNRNSESIASVEASSTTSTTTTSTISTTIEAQEDSVEVESIEPNVENLNQIIPREQLFDGNKIAEITVTNPDGELLVNIPLYVVTNMLSAKVMDDQLERGAILMVADPAVNPDIVSPDRGIPQMGIPGEDNTSIVFGHNVSNINPDWDGNPTNGGEGLKQKVFNLLDEAVAGAELKVQLSEAAGGALLTYSLDSTSVIRDVQPGGSGTGMTIDKALELYSGPEQVDYKSGMRLVKCSPDGQVTDRFVADFKLINITER